ncbi:MULTISPECIES: SdpI family protein [Bifidobacterium]|uniref:SdpI family protein n=1 Tax=Bifidobacterium TaxID=1678 RepID=UPI0018DCD1C9|nr:MULTISPECIES: SdpI family protein [Bifidobacterium]MBH9979548.1 SdpI family protein [Bifidobacterium asteroides]MBI0099207.1 SdpI family protein [Bifidobacterium sp. W8114]
MADGGKAGRFVPTLVVAQWLPGMIMLGVTRIVVNRLPNKKVPLHWNAKNQVDRWGSPQELVWMPCICLIIALIWTIMMFVLRAYLIKRGDEAGHTLTVFLLGGLYMQIVFAVIDTFSIAAADPHLNWWPTDFGIDKVVILLTGLALIVIGNFAPKIRPNGISGFRVPGAYSSREAWRRCQQFGGVLFMILGVVMILSALAYSGVRFYWICGTALAIVLVLIFAYGSYAGRKYAGQGGPIYHR